MDAIQSMHEDIMNNSLMVAAQTKPEKSAAAAARNISNQHTDLKLLVKSMMIDLCGVEKSATKAEQIAFFLEHLQGTPEGAPYELVNEQQVWQLLWNQHIDHKVNVKFLQEVVDCLWENEDIKLPDKSFDHGVMMAMAKGYWHNLTSQVISQTSEDKVLRQEERNTEKHCCG
ncbi:hypothetical protein V8B97DRAFT_1914502 [Scleroderma yunnanense]